MAGLWLCSLVALLWTPGDACWPTEEPPYPDWLKPTEALPTPDPLLPYHQLAGILSWSMLTASLCLSTFICCCSLRWSRSLSQSNQSSYEQLIEMEELEPDEGGQASTSPEPLLGPVAAADDDDTDEPFSLPIVHFHRAQDDSSEEDEGTTGSLVHRNVSCLPETPGLDTEPPAEQ